MPAANKIKNMAEYTDPLLQRSGHFICQINRDFCLTKEFCYLVSMRFPYELESMVELNEKIDSYMTVALMFKKTDSTGVFVYAEYLEIPPSERTVAQNIQMVLFYDYVLKEHFPQYLRAYVKKIIARRLLGEESCLLVNPHATGLFDTLEWAHYYVSYETKTIKERRSDMIAYCMQQVGVSLPPVNADDLATFILAEEDEDICPMCQQDMSTEKEEVFHFNGYGRRLVIRKCSSPHCFYIRCPPIHFSGDRRILKDRVVENNSILMGQLMAQHFQYIDAFDPDDDDSVNDVEEEWENEQMALWQNHNQNP